MNYIYLVEWWPNGMKYGSILSDCAFRTEEDAYNYALKKIPDYLIADLTTVEGLLEGRIESIAEKFNIPAEEVNLKDLLDYYRGKRWQILKKEIK
jgi:hypothetical protein